MASLLNPYISFTTDARQAMEFYQTVFGGDLTLSTFGELGDTGADADKIMHAQLVSPSGYTLMGADTPEGVPHQPGTTISVSLSGDDTDELHGYWDKLAEGGAVTMPLEMQMWGDEFGMVTDRYGIGWMVNVAGDHSADEGRAPQA
ncbi:MAG: VOC family protein [Humibacillus sp.]